VILRGGPPDVQHRMTSDGTGAPSYEAGSGYTDVTENPEKAGVDNVSKSFVCINPNAVPTLSPSFDLLKMR
jgi:hypothetical protein